MYAQLRGNNQGLVKLIGAGLPKNPKAGKIKIEKKTKLSILLNSNQNSGMVVMKKAMEIALVIAKKYGFAIVGTNNTKTSTGAIGYYANEIAKKGYLGFIFAGSPETVCAYGSYQPIFGTNPLAIGIPTKNEAVVLDMATASMAFYGLIEAKTAGRKIPEGIAYDKDGRLTTNPTAAMDGAIRPFDKSYKSTGLAMIVEILTGPLVSASFVGIGDTVNNWGNLIFIIDPELLISKNQFKTYVSQMINRVKQTKKLPGVKEVFVPGERGNRLTQKRQASREIEVEDNLFNQLKQVAEKH
jgi:LDH2 family malate/lactate/ureidoglycolate dehydrogenase